MIKNKRDAIASHTGNDSTEMKDYIYHYGHTSQTVYAFTDCYYCVTKGMQKPAKHRDIQWDWKEVQDNYINKFGFRIWKAGTE